MICVYAKTVRKCLSISRRIGHHSAKELTTACAIMSKELLGSVVLATAIGALVSSLVRIVAQWRERAARQRELLFNAAVDISKSYIGRVASRKHIAVSEVMAVEQNYRILTVFLSTARCLLTAALN